MENKKEYFRFFCETMRRNNVTVVACHEYQRNAWPDEAPSKMSVYRYYRTYANNRQSFKDADRTGRPSTSTSNEKIEVI